MLRPFRLDWHVAGVADFNGDGPRRHSVAQDTGQVTDWLGNTAGGFTQRIRPSRLSSGPLDNRRDCDFTATERATFCGATAPEAVPIGWAARRARSRHNGATAAVATNWGVAATATSTAMAATTSCGRETGGQLTDWLGTPTARLAQNSGAFSQFVAPTGQSLPPATSMATASTTSSGAIVPGSSRLAWHVDRRLYCEQRQISQLVSTTWHVASIGDFNGDGRDDILWRNDTG